MIRNPDPLDIRLLRIFDTLIAEGSVSRAADRLGLSQPATSRALARLRQHFGDPLLLRSRHGMTPTERAAQLARTLRPLLDQLDALLAPPAPFDPARSSRGFVLSAPEYAEHLLMPGLLRRMRTVAPGVRVDVRAPDPPRSLDHLERGEVDLRIAWVLKVPPTLRTMPLWQDRIVCVADRRHPHLRGGTLSLEQYLKLPHVRPLGLGRTTTGQVLDAAVGRLAGRVPVCFGVQNFLSVPRMLVGTDAIATMPRALALAFASQHDVAVFDPPLTLPRVRYAAYWHERSHKDAGHRWLRQLVVEEARSLAIAP
jgi:DNA-binding transcriptional LysR family regulator